MTILHRVPKNVCASGSKSRFYQSKMSYFMFFFSLTGCCNLWSAHWSNLKLQGKDHELQRSCWRQNHWQVLKKQRAKRLSAMRKWCKQVLNSLKWVLPVKQPASPSWTPQHPVELIDWRISVSQQDSFNPTALRGGAGVGEAYRDEESKDPMTLHGDITGRRRRWEAPPLIRFRRKVLLAGGDAAAPPWGAVRMCARAAAGAGQPGELLQHWEAKTQLLRDLGATGCSAGVVLVKHLGLCAAGELDANFASFLLSWTGDAAFGVVSISQQKQMLFF